ncbi:plasmid replication, integration and excision activator [Nonomuraea sp. NPDC004297]
MALQGPIPVTFAMVFPHGCYIVGEVEPVKDFDASAGGRFVQARDKQTAELVWQVAVMDGDPTLKPAQKTVAVKILAPVQPVPPQPMPGLPFTPVEFDSTAEADRKIADSMDDKINQSDPDADDGSSGVAARLT